MDINSYVSLYEAPSIYNLQRRNVGFFPLSNASFITSLSFFFFSRSSQIRSSVIQTPSLRSRFFRMTLYLSGRYTNLHIITRGLESLLGPARWAFSSFGSKLQIWLQIKLVKFSFVGNRPVPRLFILTSYLTGDFGACNKLTTEQAYDTTFVRFFKSSLLREYKTQID